MVPPGVERKLAAILAADMVGYSRLMGADEAGTIARQRDHRQDLIDPEIAKHNGRVVKTTGDGLLAEFASVVDAVQCAVAVQRAMSEREVDLPEDRRIRYRIGVNLGDIVVEGDDILGDGVNVAARLEGLADPGGICLSRAARDQVRDKLDIVLEDMGEVEVKNIARPIRAFRILLDAEPATTPGPDIAGKISAKRWVAAAAVLIVLVGGGLWWWQAQPDFEPADPAKMAFALPEEPSIAVLPFDNLSGDPEQEYLSDGLTENIISVLSSVPNLFVIARNSTFTYKGKPVKVQQVAQELGVRYVLEGSVQRSGEKLRVIAQLVDAIQGTHLWSARYDRDFDELFALQDEITLNLAKALRVELISSEGFTRSSHGTGNLEAWLSHLRAGAAYTLFSKEGNAKARRLAQETVELDPQFAGAWNQLAWTHLSDFWFNWSESPGKSLKKAGELAAKSISLDDTFAEPYTLLAFLTLVTGQHDKAVTYHEKAIALDRNDANAKAMFAMTLGYAGRPQDAIARLEKAMRLHPRYPSHYLLWMGRAYRLTGRVEEAIAALVRAKERTPGNVLVPIELAVIYSESGRQAEAEAEVADILRLNPNATVRGRAKLLRLYKDSAERDRVLAALRKAGLPD
jgi:TolB-like protein/class 3 adenylate cyclase